MQRAADGKVPVKGHDAKVESLSTPESKEEELCKQLTKEMDLAVERKLASMLGTVVVL
jgi:hypothetical protein